MTLRIFLRNTFQALAIVLSLASAAAAADKAATVNDSETVTLEYVGKEDGQDTWRGLAENGALLEYDIYPHSNGTLYSLTVDLSRNDPKLRNIPGYKVTVDGHNCVFPDPKPNMKIADPQKRENDRINRQQRIMCRTRFTWGEIPPKRSQTFYEFLPLPRQPEWNPSDWTIEPGGYGPCASPPPNTGSGEDRSCHHPNWYGSDEMLRAYADADGNYAVAVREPDAPYAPIARNGFQMGYNEFSHAAYEFEKHVGRKYQLPHATHNSHLPYLLWGDLYYKRSIIFMGNYAAMYNAHMPWPKAASEYRGVFRGLNAMLIATSIDGDEWRKKRITDTLAFFDRCAADPFGKIGVKGGVPAMITKRKGKTFINYWMTSFAFYTLDLASRLGYTEGQVYLKSLMDFQEQLKPSTVGCYFPYWLYIKDAAKPVTDISNLEASNKVNDREADGYIIGEIMRRWGRTPPRPLSGMMQSEGMYPVRNNAAYFIVDSTRPVKPK